MKRTVISNAAFIALMTSNSLYAAPRVEERNGRVIARFESDENIGSRFSPDAKWDEMVIARNVTLTGSILVPRERSRPMIIRGEDRNSSRIRGTGTYEHIQARTGFAREHSAIINQSSARLTIRNMTSINPDKFHILGGDGLLIEGVTLIDDRKAHTTDGVGGGVGTIARDIYVDSYDDSFKIYAPDMLLENITVKHNRNGAPIQFGWHAEKGNATIRNLKIIANSVDRYNQGIFSRAKKRDDAPALSSSIIIDGLEVVVPSGMKRPQLFQFGTHSGGKIEGFELTVIGLCSGPTAPYRSRADINAETAQLNGSTARLVTPDCK